MTIMLHRLSADWQCTNPLSTSGYNGLIFMAISWQASWRLQRGICMPSLVGLATCILFNLSGNEYMDSNIMMTIELSFYQNMVDHSRFW